MVSIRMKMELNAQQFGFTICSHSCRRRGFPFQRLSFCAQKKKAAKIRWENEVFHSSAYFLYRKQWKH